MTDFKKSLIYFRFPGLDSSLSRLPFVEYLTQVTQDWFFNSIPGARASPSNLFD